MSEHVIKRHNKNLMLYHLVCPIKYRRKVLTEDVEEGLKQICLEIEKCYEIGYVEIGADEDHVHFLIQSVPSYLPSAIVQTTKSITAKQIFIRFPEVKRMLWGGKFWTRKNHKRLCQKPRSKLQTDTSRDSIIISRSRVETYLAALLRGRLLFQILMSKNIFCFDEIIFGSAASKI